MKAKKTNVLKTYFEKHPTFKRVLKNILVVLIVVCCVIPLQIALGALKSNDEVIVKDENIFLIFTVAVIIVLIQTKHIIYGIVSSLIFVLSFNLLNAEPIGTLEIYDANYYISFLIFIVVSLIVGTLVIDLQKQNKQAIESNKKVNAMYDLSSRLLDNHDRPYIFNYVVEFFHNNLKYDFGVADLQGNFYGSINDCEEIRKMMEFCLDKNVVVGKNTFSFKDSIYLAFPIRSKDNNYGALFAILNDSEMPKEEIEFIHQNIFHLVVALDREFAIKEQQSAKIDVEREKLKNALLRSLSHDLKTPLTSIKSGSDLILSNYDKISEEEKREIISDIYHESCDLNEFIVNLLNMTKLNQDKSLMKRKNEPVDEILSEVRNKFSRNLADKTLEIKDNEEIVFVYADTVMLEQVFANLISNAIKHTKPNTKIQIEYYKNEKDVVFKVIDNGGGINSGSLDKIFEDFYTLALKQDHHRGTGLGLSICRAIVEAHGGQIKAYNNDIGGATFQFNIPNENKEELDGK